MKRTVRSYAAMVVRVTLGIAGCVYPASLMGGTFIVKDGKGEADIVTADKPPRMATLAAEELQTYIEKILGAKLPITNAPCEGTAVHIYVGASAHTDRLKVTDEGLKYGAFRMVSGKNWLVLLGHDSDFKPREPFHSGGRMDDASPAMVEWDKRTGATWGFPTPNLFKEHSGNPDVWEKDERGSLNAAYEFLRMQGVRWYLPDPLGEIVPKNASIEFPKLDKTVKPDFALRFPFQYGHMFGNAGATRDEVLWQLRLGFDNSYVGPADASIAHGSRIVHERAEMQKAHPEYYALYGGKRDTENGGSPCLSSPGFFQENVRYVRAVFDIYDVPMVSAMPQDGYVNLCQCGLCKGKDTPQRGWTGQLSDYVWDYVNRVAIELYKTHPNKKISCFAYGAYLLPPEKIERLSPNIVVGICQNRSEFHDPAIREQFRQLREAWLKKTGGNPLMIGDYYLAARPNMPWEGVPVFYPRLIAEDLRSLKGISLGNFIEVYRDPNSIHSLAADHLNLYVTARCWWDANTDVNALLEEYYTLYYGPARAEMKTLIEYCEGNWMDMRKSADRITRVFDLLAAAQKKAPADSVYARRIALIADYIRPMNALREQLVKGRKDAPKVRAYWREKATLTLDGKVDDEFWQHVASYPLSDLETGRQPGSSTGFKVAWAGDSIYFCIRCADRDAAKLNIATTRNQDPSMWNGDCVEIHLETQTHSFYQLAVNPAGALISLDRKNGAIDDRWSAKAESAAYVGDGFWSVEVRVPVPGEQQEQIDPRNGVSGKMPTETYPWYINVFRQRIRETGKEASAFSPTGKPIFYDPMKFAELYVR